MDKGSVVSLLENTLNFDNTKRKAAEAQLAQIEKNAGFSFILLDILKTPNTASQATVAAVYLKNMIIRRWQLTVEKHKDAPIANSEKPEIRSQLLHILLSTSHTSILSFLSISIAHIAKTDFPNQWPELFMKLVETIKTPTSRVFYTIYLCAKAIKSRKRPEGRDALLKMSGDLLMICIQYLQATGAMQSLSDSNVVSIRTSCLKMLTVFVKSRIFLLNSELGISLIKAFVSSIEFLLLSSKDITEEDDLWSPVQANLKLSAKFLLLAQKKQPKEFLPYLSYLLKLFYGYITSDENIPEGIRIQSILFFHNVFTSVEYRGNPKENQGAAVMQEFFVPEVVTGIGKTLITKYMITSSEDLEVWAEDPEGFVAEELQGDTKHQIKATAETLFITLIRKFTPVMAPFLNEMLQYIIQEEAKNKTQENMLLKDAVYNAFSLSYFELRNFISFPQFYQNFLLIDLQNPEYSVIKKRITQIISGWVSGIPNEMKPSVYSVLLSLLQSSDFVLQVWAAIALKNMVDDVESDKEVFLPYVEQSVSLIGDLIQHTEDINISNELLSIISVFAAQLGSSILPFSPSILSRLDTLWTKASSDEEASSAMLKTGILRCLKKLVQALEKGSLTFIQFFVSVVNHSVFNSSETERLALGKDGLHLWKEVLVQGGSNPGMVSLVPTLLTAISLCNTHNSYENLYYYLELICIYVLQSQDAQFLEACFQSVLNQYAHWLANWQSMRSADIIISLKLLEIFITILPASSVRAGANILKQIADLIFSPSDKLVKLMPYFVNIFSKLCYLKTELFVEFINVLNSAYQTTGVAPKLISLWIAQVSHVAETRVLRSYIMGLFTFSVTFSEKQVMVTATKELIQAVVDVRREPPPVEEIEKLSAAKDPAMSGSVFKLFITQLNESCGKLNVNIQEMLASFEPKLVQKLQEIQIRSK